jgi:pyridoxal phosphate-dependent aminotransferase EpsN
VGAEPVFVDCDPDDWHLSPYWLEKAIMAECSAGHKPKALVVADLYGGMARYRRIEELCAEYEITLVEDAAESFGATYCGRPAGSLGQFAALSFNGNKIITTSGGGALLTDLQPGAEHALMLSAQAREPHMLWHHHAEEGYTYRLSNVLAAVGLAQLEEFSRWVTLRQSVRNRYAQALESDSRFAIVSYPPEVQSSDWLTVLQLASQSGLEPSKLQQVLANRGIESRRTWAPLHAMPLFEHCRYYGAHHAAAWFDSTLCLPSGTFLNLEQQEEIVALLLATS